MEAQTRPSEGIGYRMKRPEERTDKSDKKLVPLNPERQRLFEREIFRLVKEQEAKGSNNSEK